MYLSASIFHTLGLLEHVELQQGLLFCLFTLLIPSSVYFSPELVILHKLLSIFTVNYVCSHCHIITQLGEELEGGHCGNAKNFLEEASNKSAKKLNFLFSFYSSIWHVTLLSESKVVKGIGHSFYWFNVVRYIPLLVKRNNTVWRGLYYVLSR